jgi:hypothetical protein
MPTTIVANHMKVAWYENAVRTVIATGVLIYEA